MGFLRFIVILFLIIYLLSLLFKFFIRRTLKKIQKNFQEQTNNYNNTTKKEGDVTINYSSGKKQTGNNDGEYVDFEEIE